MAFLRNVMFFVALLSAASPLAAEHWATPDLGRTLKSGHWNERMYAVSELGRRGRAAFPELKQALEDPDWQVRLTAVHWVGRLGPPARASLESALRAEKCPLVRLAAVHILGRIGDGGSISQDVGREEAQSECKAWTWPLTGDYIHARGKRPKVVEFSSIDEKGCQYIQFKKSGGDICPDGFSLKGVGWAPGDVEILKKRRPPKSGVALCCKEDAPEAVPAVKPVKPQGVECRLHPIQCPDPWREMARPDGRRWSSKDRDYRRTGLMKKGAITWVHCCRPHSVEVAQYFPPAENSFVRAIPERPVAVAEQKGELEDYVEPESSTAFEEFGEMPEEEIARKILAKHPKPQSRKDDVPAQEPKPAQSEGGTSQSDYVDRDVRVKAMDSLLTSDLPDEYEPPEAPLPGPKGADERASVGYTPQVARMPVSRDGAVNDLDAPPESFGEGEGRLASPAGLPSRSSLKREDSARYMKDAGKKIVYDPLPDLMAALASPDMLRKSRAIDEIGRLGGRGRKAAAALKKLIRDKNPRIRAGAALALGNVTISTDEALGELRRALGDESADVRYSAAMALGRIGTPESRRIFEKHMRRETRRFLRTSAD